MTERESVEAEIRNPLQVEPHTVTLHHKLFAPGALFSRLASTAEERRAVTQTPIWKETQAKLRELESRDGSALNEAVAQIQTHLPNTSFRLRLEAVQPIERNTAL